VGESLDKYLLAGLDDRERGFSRPVALEQTSHLYRAILQYESIRVATEAHPTQDGALLALIQTLHAQGYRQLRTQVSFRHGTYLGSQEPWIEYPDPLHPAHRASGLLTKLLGWCCARKTSSL
jgi:hypothetical protein